METSVLAPLADHAIELLSLVLTALISVGIAYLKKAVENSEFKDSLTTTLEAINTMSHDAVNSVAMATREAMADGKITAAERATIQKIARKEFETVISPKMVNRLNVHTNDADKFITAKINEAVENAMTKATKPQ